MSFFHKGNAHSKGQDAAIYSADPFGIPVNGTLGQAAPIPTPPQVLSCPLSNTQGISPIMKQSASPNTRKRQHEACIIGTSLKPGDE